LVEGHSRKAVEVFCYSDVAAPDATTFILRTLADNWRDVHEMDDRSLADMIRADRIDILVDLAGHSAGNRLSMFALKPAPVQASWLGYPATTGLSAIDYRITDAIADPEGEADLVHAEKLLRLPDGFLCYAPPEHAPAVSPPPCETAGHITFGTFNNPAKISPEAIGMWASILSALPTSRLLLKNKIFREDKTRAMFLALFEDAGIPSHRVTCLAHTASSGAHLETYRSLDISLDTYPYNGTTTTCESLWMGVPVITLMGDRHASRVSASILTRLRLDDLIAGSEEEYVEIALRLAADAGRLLSLRKGLRKTMKSSPLCDRRRFSLQMEEAYRCMANECFAARTD
ncbi:MAG TPA: glycosyltransferase, partial [Geobacteraceae bacterium]